MNQTIFRNVAGQSLFVFAYDANGDGVSGEAANITAQISKDKGTSAATNDTNPTELDATNHAGLYYFDLTQAESDADLIVVSPSCSSSGVFMDPVVITTEPRLFTFGKASGTPSTTSIPTDLTETTSDHYKGMFIMFLSGACAGQSSKISAYNGSTKTLTVDTLTDAPASGDEFVIIGGS